MYESIKKTTVKPIEQDMDYDKLLQAILEIGEQMLIAGAEVSRVEDSIIRLCRSYSCYKVNVFIITSNMQVTMITPQGKICTQIRRVDDYGVNFDRLDYLNDLSRRVCREKYPVEQIYVELEKVMSRPSGSLGRNIFASILVSAGFSVFFSGSFRDVISSAILGVIISLLNNIVFKKEKNLFVSSFAVSFISGVSAFVLVLTRIGSNVNIIMIAGIMILIPGIAMTNSIRDMLTGDIATGTLRLLNSVMIAISIASGFALSIILGGRFL